MKHVCPLTYNPEESWGWCLMFSLKMSLRSAQFWQIDPHPNERRSLKGSTFKKKKKKNSHNSSKISCMQDDEWTVAARLQVTDLCSKIQRFVCRCRRMVIHKRICQVHGTFPQCSDTDSGLTSRFFISSSPLDRHARAHCSSVKVLRETGTAIEAQQRYSSSAFKPSPLC